MNCCHCQFWGQDPIELEDGAPEHIAYAQDHKPCHHSHVGGGSPLDESRKASDALNGSDHIETGPFFGCKHYKDNRL